ncbi:hypothetical protein BSL78_16010 [Apostichopus japonicus]|uniref:Uncharacterized protein n=1 Tax=Stichopus japonicus TaxID=307972 RepID=A0A2G8KGI8_STIJA|nr:hypothetical protein BSL78_16010 [Apostichopus japonicus]
MTYSVTAIIERTKISKLTLSKSPKAFSLTPSKHPNHPPRPQSGTSVGQSSVTTLQRCRNTNSSASTSTCDRHICDYINIVDPDDGREENDEVLNAVIEESLLEVQDTSDQPSLDARLQESLENFQKAKMLEAPMIVVVRRRKVLSLLMQHVPDMGIFEGTSPQLYLTHSINHLNRGLYRVAGQFIAWSLLHGGPGCPVFHPVVYNMMCDAQGTSEEKLKIRDVTDEEVVQNLQMISDSTTQEDMDRVVENVGQWAAGRGCPEIFGAKVADKDNIIQRLLQQHVFYGCKAAIDQLQEGLGSVGGLWDLCKAQSRPYKKLFVAGISSPLTYMGMKKLFTINWVDDVDRRVEKEEEEDTVYCWEQFLRQSERGECSMVIGGTEQLPPPSLAQPRIEVCVRSRCGATDWIPQTVGNKLFYTGSRKEEFPYIINLWTGTPFTQRNF